MAGESPDKSEQRKSSGETTPDERDPRLAVARSAGVSTEGRVDQPTAVFRTQPSKPSKPSESSESSEPSSSDTDTDGDAPESASGSGSGSDSGSEAGSAETDGEASDGGTSDGDDRLRAVVAAWVTRKDTGEDTAEEPEDEPSEPADEASDEAGAGEAASEDDDASQAGAKAHEEPADADEADSEGDEDGESPEDAAADTEPEAAAAEDADEAADDAPLDQPTAVFKALPRPAVDQPTTALKVPTPPARPKPAPETEAERTTALRVTAPESDAERTSTFVPLRRDDGRPVAPAKPTTPAKPATPTAPAKPATAAPATPQAPARQSAPAKPTAPAKPVAAAPPVSLTEPERTKQQPLPPKPPLDLLAELTNTPPPAQTPVRTVVRRFKIWTPLVALLVIVFAVVQSVRPLPEPTLSLTAKPTFSFDGSAPQLPWPAKGQAFMAASGLGTLGSSGEQKPVPIASVTKSMTAYVILKEHPLKRGEEGPMIEIDAKGESDGQLDKTDNESTLNTVKKGDKISLKAALSAIMIPSANNIARQLARWDAGSEEAFVDKMNAAAKELGMTNTTYTDPSGLNATTVSTAEDQVKLGLKLVEIPALMDITKLPEWTDPSGKTWRNYNELPPFDGALGIKTGSTSKAGGNLLFAAHKMVGDTDQLIVGAVLAQHDTPILGTAINASRDLMIATQNALKSATIVKKGQVVGTVEDGFGGSVPVVATKDVKAVGWSGLTVKLKLANGGKALPHTAAAGTVVGSLTVGEGASRVTVPVALQEELMEPGFGAKLTRVG